MLIFWYSWLEEINQKQLELGAARITVEKLRQQEHFMVAEIELLKVHLFTFLSQNSHSSTTLLMGYLVITVAWQFVG